MDFTALKQNFITKITALIHQIETFKAEHPTIYLPDYDYLKDELVDILQKAAASYQEAETDFNLMSISNDDNFTAYVARTNPKFQNASNIGKKIIVHRDKPKNKKCPNCGLKLTINENKYYCHGCNEFYDIATSASKTKISSESTKHITKTIYLLCGICAPPSVIISIIENLRIWFLEYKYIFAYLSNKPEKKEEFLKYYEEQYNTQPTPTQTLPATPENTYGFHLYRFFTDEFYLMLEDVKKVAKLTSNIYLESPETIEKIFTEYHGLHGNSLPEPNEKFKNYDVGNYIQLLKLVVNYSAEHPKNILKKIYPKHNFDYPGLMFNYLEQVTTIDSLPRRYAYLQVIPYVLHEIFHIQYPNIAPKDRTLLIELLVEFNKYFKSFKSQHGKSNSNSPLFACSILFALKLPYFSKYYADVIKLIPQKDSDSIESTNSVFFNFSYFQRQYLEKFRVPNNEEIETSFIPPSPLEIEADKENGFFMDSEMI